MQKIEYHCDRCGTPMKAEHMFILDLKRPYVPKPIEPSEDELRDWLSRCADERRIDLCHVCNASFKDWLGQAR